MMRKLAFTLALMAFAGANATAGQVVGSAAFGGGVSDTSSLDAATSVNLIGLAIGPFDAATGDYVGRTPTVIGGAGPLNFAWGSAFSFSSALFGTFTGKVAFDDNTGTNARTIYLQGMFTAGNDPIFVGLTDPTTATVILSLNQAGGAGNSISISGTLVTPRMTIPTPEPTSIASALVGLGLVGFVARRRRTS